MLFSKRDVKAPVKKSGNGNRRGSRTYGAGILITAATAALLAGCGSGAAGNSAGGASAQAGIASEAAGEADVRTVYVAVGATFEPYTYIDENNEPAGYDVAVLKEIDERLPAYEFKIENMELANISVALDAKKVSIGSQQFERNAERESKYLFTEEGFANYNKRIAYKAGRTDIHSIDDLAGKRVSAGQGSNTATILEKFNKEHPDTPIEIVYSNGATDQSIYDDVMNGRLDAIVATRKSVNRYNDAFGGGYEICEDGYFSESQAYFMLAQGEEELRDAMDDAMRAMKEDGTLTALSMEYTGTDYTAEE